MTYDADYYERGIETGKSNYQNYRWIPDLTFPMAVSIMDYLKIRPGDTVLDYGCAKGYLVKALRMCGRDAWGCDISEYALSHADEDIRPFLARRFARKFKYAICKDVLEHIKLPSLMVTLKNMKADILFSVIPLGENGKYYATANDRDVSHIICMPALWWVNLFEACGWKGLSVAFKMDGVKDHYPEKTHAFMIHRRQK